MSHATERRIVRERASVDARSLTCGCFAQMLRVEKYQSVVS